MMEVPGLTKSLITHLRGKIIRGELAPGERINEAQLAYDLGISRSPLREALRVLERERLIASVPRKGSLVTDVSPEDLDEIYQMREMIECYALDVLERQKITDLPQVASCVANPRILTVPTELDSAEDKMAYIEALAEFHLKLVESSGNRRLFEFCQTIHSNINRYVFLNGFLQGAIAHRVEDHDRALELIKKGQYKKARQIIRSHIRFSCEQLKAKMENQRASGHLKQAAR
jgi:DNA-binding GntR family transcriptional regulator